MASAEPTQPPLCAYSIFDCCIETEIELDLPLADAGKQAAISIRMGNGAPPVLPQAKPVQGWDRPVGMGGVAVWRVGEFFFVRAATGESFLIASDGRDINVWSGPAGPANLNHYLTTLVIPLAVSLLGGRIFHAAGVAIQGRCVLFLGASGAGKSTLAASFRRAGDFILSDDCMVLQKQSSGFVAIPSFPSLRLWDDSIEAVVDTGFDFSPISTYSRKRRLVGHPVGGKEHSGLPVSRIYVLDRLPVNEAISPAVLIESLGSAESFRRLLDSQIWLDTENIEYIRAGFSFLGELVRSIPISRLIYPSDYSVLGCVRDTIIKDLILALSKVPVK